MHILVYVPVSYHLVTFLKYQTEKKFKVVMAVKTSQFQPIFRRQVLGLSFVVLISKVSRLSICLLLEVSCGEANNSVNDRMKKYVERDQWGNGIEFVIACAGNRTIDDIFPHADVMFSIRFCCWPWEYLALPVPLLQERGRRLPGTLSNFHDLWLHPTLFPGSRLGTVHESREHFRVETVPHFQR